jgi:aspartate kinase
MKTQTLISVKKFGGTSVGSVEKINKLAQRIRSEWESGKGGFPVAVVSAMAGETNRLVALGEQIFPNHRGPAYDMLVASGEQVAVALLTMALEKIGLRAKPYLAYQLGIITDSMYSRARIQNINTAKILADINEKIIPVVAGFQGIDEFDNITTLGRGGTDTTAVALAAALGARECEINKDDVPAVLSADPRIVPKAREIRKMSFDEMIEMASLGSKVLHIRAVEMGAKYGVRIHVRSTFEDRQGTWIVPEGEMMENPLVAGVTHESSTAVLKLFPVPEGTEALAGLFEALTKRGIVVDIITQSESPEGQRLAFSVPAEDVVISQEVVRECFGQKISVEVMKDVSKVSIVGVGMRNHPGVAATFFRTLAKNGIDVHLVTTSEIKVSAIIDKPKLERAARDLHSAFKLDAE